MLGNGYFIRNTGFFYPLLTATIVFVLAFVFTYFFVHNPETQIIVRKGKKKVLEPLKSVFRAVRYDKRKLADFILCNLAFMVQANILYFILNDWHYIFFVGEHADFKTFIVLSVKLFT